MQWLDRLALTRLGHRSAFQAMGIAGLYAAFAVLVWLGLVTGRSVVVLSTLFAVGMAVPLLLILLGMRIRGSERLVQQPYGELAAAMTEDTLVAHQLKQLETGRGTLAGNLSGEAPAAGITQSDCTILVLDILERAFTAQGRGADWKKVRAEAYKLAGSGKLSGLHIQKALVSEAGWKGIFWAPNPRFAYTSAGDEAEHASAYKEVREKQTYKGLPVGPTVIDYRPGPGSKTTQSLEGIERLRKIPFGVLSARGATHMALVVRGAVIEVHWKETSDKPNVIEGTPLEKWGWLSGAIVAPAEDVDAAFPPPAR